MEKEDNKKTSLSVQELIDLLSNIEDKSKLVYTVEWHGYFEKMPIESINTENNDFIVIW